jgi:hypothetical protein
MFFFCGVWCWRLLVFDLFVIQLLIFFIFFLLFCLCCFFFNKQLFFFFFDYDIIFFLVSGVFSFSGIIPSAAALDHQHHAPTPSPLEAEPPPGANLTALANFL